MWQVIGQSRAVSLLKRSLERGTLAHAYLLEGPSGVGKMTLALNIAQAVNCEAAEPPCGECDSCRKIALGKHADVEIIGLNSSEGKPRTEIGIDRVREVQHSSSLPPFEGRCRVFIIDGGEYLSTEAANCLLKTLEEPAGGVFILLTASARLLLTTVVSRCQRLDLPPLAVAEVEAALGSRWGVDPQRARLLARLCRGCLGWAVSAAGEDSWLRQRTERVERLLGISTGGFEERFAYAGELAAQFSQDRGLVWEALDLWLDWWRDLLLVKAGCSDAITNVDMLGTLAERARGYSMSQIGGFIRSLQATKDNLRLNANPRLALEVLMLDIPRWSS